MKVFCEPCGKNHTVNMQQAEQMLYVLQAALADAERLPPDCDPELACFDCVMQSACEQNNYQEFVQQQVTARKQAEGRGRK